MTRTELRDLADDDLDAVFDMMRDPESVAAAAFTADDPDDRAAFDRWIARVRADEDARMFAVAVDGAFVGTAGLYSRDGDGDREATYWIARSARGKGVGTAALEQLVSREPERPLYARVAAHNHASIAVLERVGFTRVSSEWGYAAGVGREVEEHLYVLLPNYDGY